MEDDDLVVYSSRILRKRPIQFRREIGVKEDGEARRSLTVPSVAQSIYRQALTDGQLSPPAEGENKIIETCSQCLLPIVKDAADESIKESRLRHIRTTAHMLSSPHQSPSLAPLKIGPESVGYRMLEAQGWSGPSQPGGLGAVGSEGIREPIKASKVKNDTIGLGHKVQPKQKKTRTNVAVSGASIRKAYELEKSKRAHLLAYMHR